MTEEFQSVPFLNRDQHRELVRRLTEEKADLTDFEIIRLFQPALFQGPDPDLQVALLQRFTEDLLERHGLDRGAKEKMRLATGACTSAIVVKTNLRLAELLFPTQEERIACACVLGDIEPPGSLAQLRQMVAEITAKKPIVMTAPEPEKKHVETKKHVVTNTQTRARK